MTLHVPLRKELDASLRHEAKRHPGAVLLAACRAALAASESMWGKNIGPKSKTGKLHTQLRVAIKKAEGDNAMSKSATKATSALLLDAARDGLYALESLHPEQANEPCTADPEPFCSRECEECGCIRAKADALRVAITTAEGSATDATA